MGAVVVYGHSFLREESKRGDETYVFLSPAGNGSDGSFELSYSSLDNLKQYCERFGVSEDGWPDYIDLGGFIIHPNTYHHTDVESSCQLTTDH